MGIREGSGTLAYANVRVTQKQPLGQGHTHQSQNNRRTAPVKPIFELQTHLGVRRCDGDEAEPSRRVSKNRDTEGGPECLPPNHKEQA